MKKVICYNLKKAIYYLRNLNIKDISDFEIRNPEYILIEISEREIDPLRLGLIVDKLNLRQEKMKCGY
ncbi:MAG: hypothetical protein ABJH72_22745 [Reichenbachiella sp.]|uniref:hypothetical protein n=1 Tax=Reichenbachiella sp. TaxID=2184521 RepID=UPI003262FAC2